MLATESQVRIQNRSGGVVSTVSLESFWTGLGASNVFDPRLLYDPYGQRWIFTAEADPAGVNPGLLVAVSRTTDPTGLWNRYFVDVNVTSPVWANTPKVGFNKDWIVVAADMFFNTATNTGFASADVFVFNKTNLYANGSGTRTRFSFPDIGYGLVPSTVYNTTLATNYLANNVRGFYEFVHGDGTTNFYGVLGFYDVGGPVNSPVFTVHDPIYSYQENVWGDFPPGNVDFAPQLDSTNKISCGDSSLQNMVFRDGSLWATHTIFIPAQTPNLSYVQWWEFTPGRTLIQQGRVVEPSQTLFGAYPSIAVNRDSDAVLGYSRFSSSQYASANYSFQSGALADALNSMRVEVQIKAGEAPYYYTNSYGENPWGRWSAAVVDPVNDTDIWVLQEYAATPSGTTNLWGVWWGRVSPPTDLNITMTEAPDPVVAGANLTYSLMVTNNRQFSRATGVRIIDTLPAGVTFVSATASQGTCTNSNGIVTCDFGTLDDAAKATATIVVTPTTAGQITNSALAVSYGPDIYSTNHTVFVTTTVTPSADVAVLLFEAPDPVTIGSNLTYTVIVTNLGPSVATGVSLTNTLPASVTLISATPSIGTCSINGGIISCNLGSVNIGAAPTVTIVVRANTAGNITNRANVVATSADLNAGNNSASIATHVNAYPTISAIANLSINEDTSTGNLSFTVGDAETPAANLVVAGTSSNPNLVLNSSIVFGGSGSARTVNVTPLPDQFGSVTITVFVTDTNNATTSTNFVLTVLAVNDPPTLAAIGNVTINEDDGLQTVSLTGITSGPANEVQALTITATSSNPTIIPNPTVTYTSPNSAGSLSFTPVANANGSATITVTVNDGQAANNTFTRTFTVTVNPVNDPPTLDVINNVSINEDAPQQTVNLTGITSGVANETQTLSVTAASSNPGLIPNPTPVYTSPGTTGSLTFTPVANANGTATITVTVNDNAGSNNITTRTFTVTVNSVNDLPTLDVINNVNLNEDASLQTVNLTGITSGAANEIQTLSITATSSIPSFIPNPTVTYTSQNSTGSLSFTPAANSNGTAIITVIVNDGGTSNNIVSRTFTVTVNAVNDAPTLDAIGNPSINEDAPLQTVNLTGIGTGAANEIQTLSITATSNIPSLIPNPTVSYTSPNATGSLTFTPAANASGVAIITVIVNDNGGSNNLTTSSFTVTINAVNDVPTLNAINNLAINEDAGLQTVGFNGVSSGAANESQTLVVSASSSNPALIPTPAVSYTSPATTGTLSFTPVANGSGSSVITVNVDDGGGSNNIVSRTFTVTVNPVNDLPTLDPISNLTISEDAAQQTVAFSGVTSGAANEVQTLSITATSSIPAVIPNPTVTYTSPNAAGSLAFTPVANANGVVTITVMVNDGGASNNITTRSFTVTVLSVNDVPTISSVPNQVTSEDVPVVFTVTVGDVETPAGSLVLQGQSSNAELVLDSDIRFSGSGSNRTVTIQPFTNASGVVTITLLVSDGNGGTNSVSFDLTVTPVNDPPTITAIPGQTILEDASTAAIAFTVDDAETYLDDLIITGSSSNPALVPNGNIVFAGSGSSRTVTVTPALTQNGTATITVRVADDATNTTTTFLLTVVSVNDAPTLDAIGNLSINEDAGVQIVALTGITSGAANEMQTLSITATSNIPSLLPNPTVSYTSPNATGSLTFTPAANSDGVAIITVIVNDGGTSNAIITRSFTVTVNAVNDVPTLDVINNVSLNEDGGLQTVSLTGITSGAANENQVLSLTVSNSNPALVTNLTVNYTSPSASGNLTFRTATNASGSAVITVMIDDGGSSNNVLSRTFTVTVNPVNDAPTLDPISNLTIIEDAALQTVNLTGISSGAPNEADVLTVTATSSNPAIIPNPSVSYTSSDTTGSLSLTPAPTAFGTVTITVTVNDGGSSSNLTSRTFTVTVIPVNDPPTLNAINNLTISEGSGVQTVNLSGITAGMPNETDTLTVTATSDNLSIIPHPTVSYGSPATTGSLSFTPVPNASGSATITVRVNDNQPSNNIVTRTFLVTVVPVNDPPTLDVINNVNINEDAGQILVNLTGITSGAPDEFQTLTVTTSNSNPALLMNFAVNYTNPATNGTLSFATVTNASGTATITVTITDGGASNNVLTRSFIVTVNPVNDLPVISTFANQTINEDGTAGPVSFTIGDVETAAVSLTLSGTSSNPTLVPNANITFGGSASNRTVTVKPATNQFGTTTISVVVSDGAGSATSSFALTVNSINDAPTISTVASQTLNEDTSSSALAFTIGDVETAATSLTLSYTCSDTNLIPLSNIILGGSGASRTVTVTPVPNSFGTAIISLTIQDTDGGSASTSFTVTVTPANDAPTLDVIGNLTINEDAALQTVNLTGISSGAANETDPLTVTATSSNPGLIPNPAVNYVSPNSSGNLTLMPVANANGVATITVTVNDGAASNNIITRTFTVTVNPVNDLPVISAVPDQAINEDTPTGAIAFTIGDVETAATSLTLSATSSNTGLVAAAAFAFGGSGSNRTVIITPVANQSGLTTITLTVSDGSGGFASSIFVLAVNPVDDAPTISAIANQSTSEDASSGAIAFTVGDLESPATSLTVSGSSSNPGLVANSNIVFGGSASNRTVTLTPAANQVGSTLISVTVRDPEGFAATTTFTLTVNAVNDPPTLSAITDQVINEDTVASIPFTVGDLETAAASLGVSGTSSNLTLVPNANLVFTGSGVNRMLTITPVANLSGTSLITVTVTDGAITTSTSFLLTVNPVNDAPTISAIGNQTINEDTATAAIAFTVGDLETPVGSLTLSATSSNPSLIPNSNIIFGGSGASRNVTLSPLANQFGTANITVTVTDGNAATASVTFLLTVNPVNDAPTISSIPSQTIDESTPITIPFTVGDPDTLLSSLVVSGSSSNPTLVPVANLVFDGNGTSRTLTITPAPNLSGTNTVTLTVSDGVATASSSFVLVVSAVNDAPTLSPLLPLSTLPNTTLTVPLAGISSGAANESQTLTVTAGSSNTGVVPVPTVTYTSPATTGSITFKTVNGASGTAVVTVTVNDGGASNNLVTQTFVVFVRSSGNANPVVTGASLTNRTTLEDTATPALAFTVGDSVTPATLLSVAGFSSNPLLVPTNNIVFGGSASNRTVTITPAPNLSGTSLITLTVTDTNFGLASTNFLLTVTPVNDAPVISTIANQVLNEDTASGPIAFTVSDVESAAGSLVVTATSSNLTLVPNASLLLGGSGTNRALVIVPATNQFGTSLITLTVSDGSAAASTSFLLTVNGVNDLPTIAALANQTTAEDTATAAIALTVGDLETLAPGLNLSATASVPSLVGSYVFGGSGANRTLVIVPAINQFGSATVTVSVDDGSGGNSSASFLFTVTPVNDPPTLDAISNLTLNQGAGAQTVNLTGISAGPANENQVLAVSATSSNPGLVPDPSVTYTSPNGGGSLTFTPQPATNGSATITVTINDGQSANNLFTRTFTVSVNAAPFLSDIADVVTSEDTASGLIAFTVSDAESAATSLVVSVTSSSNPALVPTGNVALGGSGTSRTLTITPVANQFGTATIGLSVSDPEGNVTSKSFVVIVTPVNDAPTLDPLGNLVLNEDAGPQNVTLTGIGSGAANESQSLTVTATSSNPSLIPNPAVTYTSPNASGSLSFTPVANASGSAVITVSVNDRQSQNNLGSRSFTVTLNPVNDAPTLDPISNLTLNEDGGLQVVNLTGIGSGAPDEIQGLSVTASSSNPSIIPNPTVTYISPNSTAVLSFTPVTNANGTATITVTVNDGGTSNNLVSRTFTVNLSPVNDLPTLNLISNLNLNEDAGLQTVAMTGISSGAADENQNINVTATSSNPALIPNPTVSYISPNATGSLTFTPAANASGSATLTVTLNDGGASNNILTRTFTVTVFPVNDVPTLDAPGNLTINEDAGAQTVNLTGITAGAPNEIDTLSLTATSGNPGLIPNPSVTYTSPNATGSLNFTPVANASGSAVITVNVSDTGASNNVLSRTFTVTVSPVNDLPTLDSLGNVTINEDSGVQTISLSGITSGSANELDTLSITATSNIPSVIPNPTVSYTSPNATGSLSFTPAANAYGVVTITVLLNDNQPSNNLVTRTFTVTVNPVNDAPTLGVINNVAINEDAAQQTVNLTGITSGAANEADTLTVTATSSNPGLIPNPAVTYTSPSATGSLSFTPSPTISGSASITVTVNDGGSFNNLFTRTFTVTVNPVNDPPTLDVINNVTINEDAAQQAVTLTGITSGATNEIDPLSITAVSSNPSLIPDPTVTYTSPSATGSLSFKPLTNANGTATITVTVNDGAGANNLFSRTFTVTVNPVNDAPTMAAIADQVINEDNATGPVAITLADVDTPATNLVLSATSTNNTLVPVAGIVFGGAGSNRTVNVQPAADQFGTTLITVRVSDGAATNSRTFLVTVNPVNDAPTLNPLGNLSLVLNPGQQIVTLTGLSSGATNETQALTVTAVSSNPALVPNPAVTYTSPNTTGSLNFTPATNSSGSATVTVTVQDNGGTLNGGLNTFSRTFTVSVAPIALRIVPVPGNQVALFWTTNAVGFVLQSRLNLSAASAWVNVTDIPVVVGNEFAVTNAVTGVSKFYQLTKPAGPPQAGLNLSVTRSDTGLVLAWPSASSGYVLESSPSISPSSTWTPVSGQPLQIGNENRLTISNAVGSKFYRLRKQ